MMKILTDLMKTIDVVLNSLEDGMIKLAEKIF